MFEHLLGKWLVVQMREPVQSKRTHSVMFAQLADPVPSDDFWIAFINVIHIGEDLQPSDQIAPYFVIPRTRILGVAVMDQKSVDDTGLESILAGASK